MPVYEADQISADNTFEVINEEGVDWIRLVERFERKEFSSGVYCLCSNPDQAWISFCGNFDLIVAAGGLVKNKKGEYLFIFRHGKWDLPKGKLDYDESPELAAVREIEEETGISELKITNEILVTFYIYTEKARRKLKKIHWYLIESESDEIPQPQIEEDIQEAKWLSRELISTKVLKNTYENIKLILRKAIGPL